MFKARVIKKLIVENVKRKGNPIGISASKLKNLNLPTNGEYLFFTGLMYQMIPYIEVMTAFMEKIEETPFEKTIELANRLSFLFRLIPSKKIEYYNRILRNVAGLLQKCGIDIYYNPDMDFYSGILLYDLDKQAFEEYVERYSVLEGKKIVTVDPHSTYALRLYDSKMEVYSYLELLSNVNPDLKVKTDYNRVILHDPCYYARYLDIIEEPRQFLDKVGVEYVNVKNSKKLTACCGAPIESISPALSKKIAENRVAELAKENCTILTLCPLCLARLQSVNKIDHEHEIRDFVEIFEL